jgi:hypothetical protein
MTARRLTAALAPSVLVAATLATVVIPGPRAAALAPAVHGWLQVPAAARGPVRAALARDGAAPAARQWRLTATGIAAGAGLGTTIAVAGNTIAVGAPEQTVGGHADQGAVYVFTRPASGWRNVKQTAELTAADGAANELLGAGSIAMTASTIAVGAVDHKVGTHAGQGAVYVFSRPAKGWRTTTKPAAELTVSNGAAGDGLGQSVGISGTTIVAGAYKRAGSHNGSPTVYQGEVYVFTRPPHGWGSETETAGLTAKAGDDLDQFGYSVAVSDSVVVVGARGVSGNIGAAYVYVRPQTGWHAMTETRQLAAAGTQNEFFGESVAMSGRTIVVGAFEQKVGQIAGAGAAYVFVMPAGGWGSDALPPVPATAVLTANDAAEGDGLGSHVAISAGRIVASAPERKVGNDDAQGAVYTYIRPSAGWKTATQSAEVVGAGGAAGDEFGASAAVAGDTMVIGAPGHDADTGTAEMLAPPGPVLSAVGQSHRRWQLGSRRVVVNPVHRPKGGDEVSFRLSQAATVSMVFSERVGRRTVSKGVLRLHVRAGANRVFIDGRTGHGKTLVPGHATVSIAATNANGSTGHRRLRLTVVSAKHA